MKRLKYVIALLALSYFAHCGGILENGGFDQGEWSAFAAPPAWSVGQNHMVLSSEAGKVDGAEGGYSLALKTPWAASTLPLVSQSFRPPVGTDKLHGSLRAMTRNDIAFWRIRELRPSPGHERPRFWNGSSWVECSAPSPLPSDNIYTLGDVTHLRTENSGSISSEAWSEVIFEVPLPTDGDAYLFELGGGTASGDDWKPTIFFDSVELLPLDAKGNLLDVTFHDHGRAIPFPEKTVDAILATQPPHSATVETVGGFPAILLDGKPVPGLGWSVIVPQNVGDSEIADMVHETGFDLIRVIFALGESCFHGLPYSRTWYGPDLYDWTPLDEQLERFCRPDERDKVIIQIAMDGTRWWCDLHPDDSIPMQEASGGTNFIPDYQSEQWQKDSRTALRALVAHIQTSPFADRVIGYELFNGVTLDCNWPVDITTKASLAYFRKMLRERYGSDEELQRAWKLPDVTLETAEPQKSYDWDTARFPQLFFPADNRRFADSQELENRLVGEVFIRFAKDIKEATHNRALTGARHGNFFYGSWDGGKRLGGWAFWDYLKKSRLDFLEQWESYPGRGLGDWGCWCPIMPVLAMGLEQKLYVTQNDVRTHVGGDKGFGATKTPKETLSKQKAVMIASLTSGRYPYIWQMDYHFNMPELLPFWQKTSEIFAKSLKLPRESNAEICFVLDKDMPNYLGTDKNYSEPSSGFALLDYSRFSWGRAGAPYDMLFLDQIKDTNYRLYVFFLTLRLSEQDITNIHSTLAANNATAIFVWADGIMDANGSLSEETMERLVGMNLSISATPADWRMRPTENYRLATMSQETMLGVIAPPEPCDPDGAEKRFSPTIIVDDPNATILAVHAETGAATLAVKKQKGWTSVYSSSAILSSVILHWALREAGGWEVMPSSDALFMNASFIGVHTRSSTSKIEFNFLKARPLYNVYTDVELPSSTHFTIKVEPCETYLWFQGSRKEWEEL